jgi:ferritin-like metal-binding protein YciE
MKKEITKLEDVLALELQNLYNGELSLKEKLEKIIPDTDHGPLQEILKKYAESSTNKRLKLDRMFSYLMVVPVSHSNVIMNKLVDEAIQRTKHSLSDKIKALVLISGLQKINCFKMTAYRTALMYALEVELDTVADLLHEIIEWERKTDKSLAELYLKEFNTSGETQSSVCKK